MEPSSMERFWDWLLTPLVRLFEAINDALEWETDVPPPERRDDT